VAPGLKAQFLALPFQGLLAAVMVCEGCGAEANASCNCGKPYMPKAARVREAIDADPDKPNKQIARETGADPKQVRRERARIGGTCPPLSIQSDDPDDEDIETCIEPENYHGAFLIRADQARRFAFYSGPVDAEIVAMAIARDSRT
jgi:hypothetical protein